MTTIEAQIILGLAENGLRVEATARKLYMHRTTLHRYIRNIKRTTGYNPLDYYDMGWLVPKAKTILGMYGKFLLTGGAIDDQN